MHRLRDHGEAVSGLQIRACDKQHYIFFHFTAPGVETDRLLGVVMSHMTPCMVQVCSCC